MAFLAVGLLGALALAGCTSEAPDRACPRLNTLARVTSVEGATVHVQVLAPAASHGPAVLHTAGARFHQYAGSLDECFEAQRGHLRAGQEIEVLVDAWMESFPPQAHVDDVVIRG